MGESKYYGDLHVFDLSKGQWVSKAVQVHLLSVDTMGFFWGGGRARSGATNRRYKSAQASQSNLTQKTVEGSCRCS